MDANAPPIAIVDVGVGNLRSVERALAFVLGDGAKALTITRDAGLVREARAVVMPGQGAFGDCSVALGRDGGALSRAISDHILGEKPYLGICLGLQVLFEGSEEAPGRSGLGVFRGTVRRFRDDLRDADGARVKIPHMGWNRVAPKNEGARFLREAHWFYFVHSYYVVPEDPSLVAGETTHGESFVSAVARGRMLGVQFHPEKSQRAGLSLLRAFFDEAMRAEVSR